MSKISSSETSFAHKLFDMEAYIHITSPIRRLIDLLNQIIFQKEFGMVERISESAQDFLNMWQSKLNQINESMQSTRKIQIDCDLLHRCNAHPEWMQHLHRGIIFDRIERKDGLYSYMVHLSELNILGRVVTQEKYVNYQSLKFRLFVFQDAEKLHRKIRLAIE
jgi:exoribonuclease R